jgi:hypothetical protein
MVAAFLLFLFLVTYVHVGGTQRHHSPACSMRQELPATQSIAVAIEWLMAALRTPQAASIIVT